MLNPVTVNSEIGVQINTINAAVLVDGCAATTSAAGSEELRLWQSRQLVGEQFFCVNVVRELPFTGGFGNNVLQVHFMDSVQGAVSLNGDTIAEFNYIRGQPSPLTVTLGLNNFAVGTTPRIVVRVLNPVTVASQGLQINTLNASVLVNCGP